MANQNTSANTSEHAPENENRESNALRGTIRDTSERAAEKMDDREAAADLMDSASQMANDLYHRASSAFSGEYRGFYLAGALAAVGLFGFMIGRRLGKSRGSDVQSY